MVLHNDLLLSELMFAPASATAEELAIVPDARPSDFAFIELHNTSTHDGFALGGLRLDGDIQMSLPDAALVPGERVVVVANEAAFVARYGPLPRVLGTWKGELSAGQPRIVVLDSDGHDLVDFRADEDPVWPMAPRGLGASLQVTADWQDEPRTWQQPGRWRPSRERHGTPGAAPAVPWEVVLSEVHAGLDPVSQRTDAIELRNAGSREIDLSGWFLTDQPADGPKYAFPAGTLLAAGGYLVVDRQQLVSDPLVPAPTDLRLQGEDGGSLFLMAPGAEGQPAEFADEMRYDRQDQYAWGRYPSASSPPVPLVPSPGAANTEPMTSSLLITEIHYAEEPTAAARDLAPELAPANLAFVEIANESDQPRDASGWRFTGDIQFQFAAGTVLAPREALVLVSFDPIVDSTLTTGFRAHFQLPEATRLVGPYTGQLSDAFGWMRLSSPAPGPDAGPEGGLTVVYHTRDEAHFSAFTPWPATEVETGQTLHRIASNRVGPDPLSWEAGPPTPGTIDFKPETRPLLPDLTYWDDPLIGFNHLELFDTHKTTGHALLRFATAAANVGAGPLIIEGRESVGDVQQVVQVIHQDDGTKVEYPAGEFVFHPTHHHVHFANYAEYNLRAVTADNGVGPLVAHGEKVSFCLVDFAPYDLTLPGAPSTWIYSECERTSQGISVGWADIYGSELDDQWIDIEGVPAGAYWLETVLDPLNYLRESNEDNNVIRTLVMIGQPTYSPDTYDAQQVADPQLGTGDQFVTQLSLHAPGDVDRFRWIAPADGEVNVQLQFDRGLGDADLYVWGNGTTSRIQLESSETDGSGEQVLFPVRAGQTYFVVVKHLAGYTLPDYTLQLDGPDIVPDALEPNNSLDTAANLGAGVLSRAGLNVHAPGDPDYYKWTAARSGDVLVDVRFASEQGDLDLLVLDAQGQTLAQSTSTINRKYAEFRALEGQAYLLLVQPKPGARSLGYELRVDEMAMGPDALEPNNSEHAPADIGSGDGQFRDLNVHRPFDRDVYRWHARTQGTAVVDLLFQHAAGDLDLVLWYDGEEVLFSRSQDDHEQFEFSTRPQQEFLIEVRGRNGATSPAYELRVDATDAPRVTSLVARRGSDEGEELVAAWPGDAGVVLPWTDVRSVEAAFSQEVVLPAESARIVDDQGNVAAWETMAYDATRRIATWTLAAPLPAGTWTLRLFDNIADSFNNRLDGEVVGAAAPSGDGQPGGDFVWQFVVVPGDLTGDRLLKQDDIQALFAGLPLQRRRFDLDNDRVSDDRDIRYLVTTLMGTSIGDANLDGVFDSGDLVQIFQQGQFEDLVDDNSTWADGDWDGDDDFTTGDLVFAFQEGGYQL